MKVLLISGFFPPQHVAGSEKRTLGYALALRKLGHVVQVLCAGSFAQGNNHWNGYTDDSYRDIAVRRVHINWTLASDPNRCLYANPVVASHLDSWMDEWQPDVVHIVSCYTVSASVIEVIRSRNVPIVLTLVDFWFVCPRVDLMHSDGTLCNGFTTPWECHCCMLAGARLYRWSRRLLPEVSVKHAISFISKHRMLNRQPSLIGMALNMEERKQYLVGVLRQIDAITAPSQVLADMIRAIAVDIDIRVIHSGHDLTWLATMPARKMSPVIRFGYIGHIRPQKGVHELVLAFVNGGFGDAAELHVYGDLGHDSLYGQSVLELVDCEHRGVKFHGSFRPTELGEILSNLDVTVVPSLWWENNPRVVQESFAGHVPVIASNAAGIAEFVHHEVNGLLFERGNVQDLTRHLRRVVEEPQLLSVLGAGIEPVKTSEQEMEEIVAIYREVRNRRESR